MIYVFLHLLGIVLLSGIHRKWMVLNGSGWKNKKIRFESVEVIKIYLQDVLRVQ